MASSRLRNIQQQLASGGKGGSPPYASPQPLAGDDGVPVITNVKAIKTAPYGTRLVVVKVETNVPGLHGVGCATLTQRPTPVCAAVDDYLAPFLKGRRVSEIEDIWQSSYLSSYWRSGPVLNNALSGVDQALWDIKGKMAGMPVHDLLGGKTRKACPVYVHADGNLPTDEGEHFAEAKEMMAMGFRHIRLQYNGYGANVPTDSKVERAPGASDGPSDQDSTYDPLQYLLQTPKMFDYARATLGDEIEFCHDTHERLNNGQAVQLAESLQKHRLFFLEDALPPEQLDHFKQIRAHSTVPIAMGELFTNIHEYTPLIRERLIDYIRVHMSDIGGITPMRKLATLCEFYGVRTALHGPGDCSPVGMMANLAIGLSASNFGIQEYEIRCFDPTPGSKWTSNQAALQEVFPGFGLHELKESMMWFGPDRPGLGVDIDEEAAARYPWPQGMEGTDENWASGAWAPVRRLDGSVVTP